MAEQYSLDWTTGRFLTYEPSAVHSSPGFSGEVDYFRKARQERRPGDKEQVKVEVQTVRNTQPIEITHAFRC